MYETYHGNIEGMSQENSNITQQTNLEPHLYKCWNIPSRVSYYSSLTGHGKYYFVLLEQNFLLKQNTSHLLCNQPTKYSNYQVCNLLHFTKEVLYSSKNKTVSQHRMLHHTSIYTILHRTWCISTKTLYSYSHYNLNKILWTLQHCNNANAPVNWTELLEYLSKYGHSIPMQHQHYFERFYVPWKSL
jgi:hypothetical protein